MTAVTIRASAANCVAAVTAVLSSSVSLRSPAKTSEVPKKSTSTQSREVLSTGAI